MSTKAARVSPAHHNPTDEQRLAFGIALRDVRRARFIRSAAHLVAPMKAWLESVGAGDLSVLGSQVRNWESDGERIPRSSPPYAVQVWALEQVLEVEPGMLATALGMTAFEPDKAWRPKLPGDCALAARVEELDARIRQLEAAR